MTPLARAILVVYRASYVSVPSSHRFRMTLLISGFGGPSGIWDLVRYRLFGMPPIPPSRLFETLNDGILVLDGRNRVLNLNRAARDILRIAPTSPVGQAAAEAFKSWPQFLAVCSRPPDANTELVVGAGDNLRHYEIRSIPLATRRGHSRGRVITLHNMIERKGSREALQWQRTLTVLEARERLEKDVAELLRSRAQSRLLETWRQLRECEVALDADWARAKTLISQVRQTIDDIREREIRLASHRLHPLVIRLGLVPAVRLLIGGFDEYFAISVEVEPQVLQLDDPLENRISERLRLAAYRIIEQALENVYRHANASRADISMGIDAGGRLAVSIRDDGCGFDTAGLRKGLGLDSIVGRVDRLGGECKIESNVGKGTIVTAFLPLDCAEEDLRFAHPSHIVI